MLGETETAKREVKRRATLSDVAKRANVSLSTVSRVATGNAAVTDGVEERVRRAAAELDVPLEPKSSARVLAFLLSNRDVLHPFHPHVLSGAQACCRLKNWDLLFLSSDYGPDVDPKDVRIPPIVLRRSFVQALVVAGTNHPNLLHALERRHIPYVVYGNNVVGDWKPANHDVVFVDDIRGAYEATAYLVSLGHRNIAYVGDTVLPWFQRTQRGYSQAMTDAGLGPRLASMHAEEREVGYLTAKSLLTQEDRPTAIFAGTDTTAEGACRAARDLGLRIPEDISICGSNNTEAHLLHPPLTTVQCFPEEIGRQLIEMALQRVAEPKAPPQQVTVPTRLIKRESCVPPVLMSLRPVG
ncbi:MAG: LacI family DNA-binding transcriptional regulator [Bryobacteraceae bacterium]